MFLPPKVGIYFENPNLFVKNLFISPFYSVALPFSGSAVYEKSNRFYAP